MIDWRGEMSKSLACSIQSLAVGLVVPVSGVARVECVEFPVLNAHSMRVQFGVSAEMADAAFAAGSWSCSGRLPVNAQVGIRYGLSRPHPHWPRHGAFPGPKPLKHSVWLDVRVRTPFLRGPGERILEPTSYLDELLSLSYISVGGAPPAPIPASLGALVPGARLANPAGGVRGGRLPGTAGPDHLAVLRCEPGSPAPAALDQRYRGLAYETLLLDLAPIRTPSGAYSFRNEPKGRCVKRALARK
jgi:hypothetical protein